VNRQQAIREEYELAYMRMAGLFTDTPTPTEYVYRWRNTHPDAHKKNAHDYYEKNKEQLKHFRREHALKKREEQKEMPVQAISEQAKRWHAIIIEQLARAIEKT
jgi:hypothetical protein